MLHKTTYLLSHPLKTLAHGSSISVIPTPVFILHETGVHVESLPRVLHSVDLLTHKEFLLHLLWPSPPADGSSSSSSDLPVRPSPPWPLSDSGFSIPFAPMFLPNNCWLPHWEVMAHVSNSHSSSFSSLCGRLSLHSSHSPKTWAINDGPNVFTLPLRHREFLGEAIQQGTLLIINYFPTLFSSWIETAQTIKWTPIYQYPLLTVINREFMLFHQFLSKFQSLFKSNSKHVASYLIIPVYLFKKQCF